jgi:signal transduction histidine kinase
MPLPLIPHKIPWPLILIFLIFVILISLVGLFNYEGQKKEIKNDKQHELLAIADLKVSQIVNWRQERLADAETIHDNVLLGPQIQHLLQGPKETKERRNILTWMESFKETHQYDDILLLDKNGTILLSVARNSEVVGPDEKQLASEALRTRKMIFSDLYRSKVTDRIHLSIVVPILSEDKDVTLGVFLLMINPNVFLYPRIERWPTPSLTAETMLIRREGDEVAFLNDLRHQKGTALTLRLPISSQHLPAAMALRGKEGIFEGIDYRGAEVLAALRSIPDTSWAIVSKVDKEEVYTPIRGRLWNATLIIGLGILSTGAGVLLIWRKREEEEQRKYREQLKEMVEKRTEELKIATEELRTAMDDLARSNADLQQFAYLASHDLQEPLQVIKGFLASLERRYKDKLDEKAHEFIRFTIESAKRMQDLIKDLLEYSRIGTKGKEFKPADCSLILDRAIFNLKVAIEESGAEVTHDSLPTVMSNAMQLTSLFQNLIGNAIKFHAAEAPKVHISAERKGDEWLFSVRDNGIGIDPKFADGIFAVFQRLPSSDKFPGTGIGLAICKKIVDLHGGRIWVDSKPGKGATFYFTISERQADTREGRDKNSNR